MTDIQEVTLYEQVANHLTALQAQLNWALGIQTLVINIIPYLDAQEMTMPELSELKSIAADLNEKYDDLGEIGARLTDYINESEGTVEAPEHLQARLDAAQAANADAEAESESDDETETDEDSDELEPDDDVPDVESVPDNPSGLTIPAIPVVNAEPAG